MRGKKEDVPREAERRPQAQRAAEVEKHEGREHVRRERHRGRVVDDAAQGGRPPQRVRQARVRHARDGGDPRAGRKDEVVRGVEAVPEGGDEVREHERGSAADGRARGDVHVRVQPAVRRDVPAADERAEVGCGLDRERVRVARGVPRVGRVRAEAEAEEQVRGLREPPRDVVLAAAGRVRRARKQDPVREGRARKRRLGHRLRGEQRPERDVDARAHKSYEHDTREAHDAEAARARLAHRRGGRAGEKRRKVRPRDERAREQPREKERPREKRERPREAADRAPRRAAARRVVRKRRQTHHADHEHAAVVRGARGRAQPRDVHSRQVREQAREHDVRHRAPAPEQTRARVRPRRRGERAREHARAVRHEQDEHRRGREVRAPRAPATRSHKRAVRAAQRRRQEQAAHEPRSARVHSGVRLRRRFERSRCDAVVPLLVVQLTICLLHALHSQWPSRGIGGHRRQRNNIDRLRSFYYIKRTIYD